MPYGLYRASAELYLYSPYGPYSLYKASVELYFYSPYGPHGLYRASVELYLYFPYGPYGLYRASVELYLYSPYGPYGLYRASVPVQGCTLPLPVVWRFKSSWDVTPCKFVNQRLVGMYYLHFQGKAVFPSTCMTPVRISKLAFCRFIWIFQAKAGSAS